MPGDSKDKVTHRKSTAFFLQNPRADPAQEAKETRGGGKPTDLDLRCCGHGVFSQHAPQLAQSFLNYLSQCQAAFSDLYSIHITFNGFDIGDGILQRILSEIRSFSFLHRVYIHTSHLRNATVTDFKLILQTMDVFGGEINCEDFSLQIAAWRFKDNFQFDTMYKCFSEFAEESIAGMQFKTFRFEISSWCITDRQTEVFLKKVTDNTDIVENLILKRGYDSHNKPIDKLIQRLNDTDKKKVKDGLHSFLQKGIQLDYSEIVMMPINFEFRQLVGKSIVESLTDARVELFHRGIVSLMKMLLTKMPEVTQFTVDFRAWNRRFHMEELQHKLEHSVDFARSEYSMMNSKKISTLLHDLEEEKRFVKMVYLI